MIIHKYFYTGSEAFVFHMKIHVYVNSLIDWSIRKIKIKLL